MLTILKMINIYSEKAGAVTLYTYYELQPSLLITLKSTQGQCICDVSLTLSQKQRNNSIFKQVHDFLCHPVDPLHYVSVFVLVVFSFFLPFLSFLLYLVFFNIPRMGSQITNWLYWCRHVLKIHISLIGNIEILSVSERILHPQGNAVHDVDIMLTMIVARLIFIVRAEGWYLHVG